MKEALNFRERKQVEPGVKEEDKKLEEVLVKAWEIATEEFDMEPSPINFYIVPSKVVWGIVARKGVADMHHHWDFGKKYKDFLISEKMGGGKVYELVANEMPNQAYLLETNPFEINSLVAAHVLGHSEFFNKNKYAKNSRKDIAGMEGAFQRLLEEKEAEHGKEKVEKFLDILTCFNYVDPDADPERPWGEEERELWKDEENFPPKPDRDILGFLRNHAPLEDWEREVVDFVRKEEIYFNSLSRTKRMNEGWAVYTHKKIMRSLQQEGYVPSDLRAEWWDLHGVVLTGSKDDPKNKVEEDEKTEENGDNEEKEEVRKPSLNPYNLGLTIFEYIEDFHNGNLTPNEKEFLESIGENVPPRYTGDIKNSPGYKEARKVMESEDDKSFIEKYYNPVVAARLGIGNWEETKKGLMLTHEPIFEVVDGNFNNKGWLYIKHEFDGRRLDRDTVVKTLPKVREIWNSTVQLESVLKNKEEENVEVVFACWGSSGNVPVSVLRKDDGKMFKG